MAIPPPSSPLHPLDRFGEKSPARLGFGRIPRWLLIGGGRYSGRRRKPRDAWKHPAVAGSTARPAFPRRRHSAREATGKRGKER
jgi:hypothetical protein